MKALIDALENCIVEVQAGEPLESVLARYPEQAAQLRPLLKAAAAAKLLAGTAASALEIRSSRARVLEASSKIRAPGRRAHSAAVPALQRLALAVGLTFFFLSGNTHRACVLRSVARRKSISGEANSGGSDCCSYWTLRRCVSAGRV
jgi:hypothetical protein